MKIVVKKQQNCSALAGVESIQSIQSIQSSKSSKSSQFNPISEFALDKYNE